MWQIDATHTFTRDGWRHAVAIIDTYDRSIVGWRIFQSGSANVAVAALEDAVRARGIEPANTDLALRSDNSLVFGTQKFTQLSRGHDVIQEYITP